MTGSEQCDPIDAVRAFVEGFNNDDVDAMQAACTDDTSIIDDFPPHQWLGSGATTRWYRDMAEWATGYDMADWSVLLGETAPRHSFRRTGIPGSALRGALAGGRRAR